MAQVVLNQEGARIVELNRDRRWRIPSSRGMIARTVWSSTGIDTELEMPDGTRRMILTERADEVPLGWSPDGRYLLYRHVIATDRPPGYEQRLAVWDAGTGEARIIYGRPGMPLGYFTPWCPTAPRIALEVGPEHAMAVVVIDLDGAELSRIAPEGLSVSLPAWSPDGTRLAFVGTREGEADIYVAGWDGSGLRRIGATPSAEQTPVWLSDLHVAAVTVGPAPRLVVQSTRGSEAVSVPLAQPVRLLSALMVEWPENATELVSRLVRSLEARQDAALPAVWLANLSIDGHDIASPGEYVAYRLTGKDPRGRSSGLLPPAVEWSVGDSTVLRSLGEGRFRALRPGSTYVRGRLPGWEGDSLLVTVRRPRALDPPVLFQEDWTAEIREDRWIPYGEPVPEVVPAGPDGTPAFDNRGDQNYHSGVISRRAFPLAGGLTVEAWVRLVPTGEGFQNALVYLFRGDATALDPDGMPAAGEVAGFDLSGTDRLTHLFGHRYRTAPLPEGVDGWLRYAIQVHPDGSQTLLVDGNVYLRGSGPDPSRGPVHLELGGRSLTSTVLIGPVTVYGGLRYEID